MSRVKQRLLFYQEIIAFMKGLHFTFFCPIRKALRHKKKHGRLDFTIKQDIEDENKIIVTFWHLLPLFWPISIDLHCSCWFTWYWWLNLFFVYLNAVVIGILTWHLAKRSFAGAVAGWVRGQNVIFGYFWAFFDVICL